MTVAFPFVARKYRREPTSPASASIRETEKPAFEHRLRTRASVASGKRL